MFTAVLVACLVAVPTECVSHEMLIVGNGIPYSAYVEAQSRAALWLSEHPGYRQSGLVIRVGRGV